MALGSDCFQNALKLVRIALLDRLNTSAQNMFAADILCTASGLRSAILIDCLTLSDQDVAKFLSLFGQMKGFHNLDILRIGEEHTYIIHREQLLNDIHVYLSNASTGFRRLLVNVDYRLEKPEIIPGNQYPLLKEYIQDVLKPEIESRVINWQRTDYYRKSLPMPENLNMVTVSGWIVGNPVLYIIPHSDQQQSKRRPSCSAGAGADNIKEEDEECHECGRNCLANQDLIITRIHLAPKRKFKGLSDHCLMSFSYPAGLSEFCKNAQNLTTESPCVLSENYSTYREAGNSGSESDSNSDYDSDSDNDNDEFVDAVEYVQAATSSESEVTVSPAATATATEPPTYSTLVDKLLEAEVDPNPMPASSMADTNSMPASTMIDPHINGPQPQSNSGLQTKTLHAHENPIDSEPELRDLGRFKSKSLLIPCNEDIYTVGRSYLKEIHHRFQTQSTWRVWEVDQETVRFPVVGLR
ncbi:hypothetical protein BGZ76_008530 [Entomortierella beljakovae]|nr:hypothetical protein BGZ76_008530 [Entomortierella beljakovae]